MYQANLNVSSVEEIYDYETFFDAFHKLYGSKESDSRHLLLGYATPIQSDYVELGPKTLTNWQYPTKTDIEYLDQWTLLFQLDSDLNSKMCWGDWGRIYYVIEKEKLKSADFSGIHVVCECY